MNNNQFGAMRRRQKQIEKDHKITKALVFLLSLAFLLWLGVKKVEEMQKQTLLQLENQKNELLKEIQELEKKIDQKTPEVSQTDIEPTKNEQKWSGIASYYWTGGCIGCRSDLLMANGERFSDTGFTIAVPLIQVWDDELTGYYSAPMIALNTYVTVRNPKLNKEVVAKVTDTGGFGKMGRIADLSPAVKEAINCNDLCEVEVIK